MLIEYKGHSCFRIKDFETTGYKIVIDPYRDGSVPGYKPLKEKANLVLCSHEHDDHAGVECCEIVDENIENPFDLEVIETYHDPEKGKLRGSNKIHILTLRESGEKVIHYGDVGEGLDDLLTDENLAKLKDADYALIPVGGVYTYDFEQALELIDRTTPKLAIAMHFQSTSWKCDFEHIGSIEDFLVQAMETGHQVQMLKVPYIDTCEDEINCEIVSLKPEYLIER